MFTDFAANRNLDLAATRIAEIIQSETESHPLVTGVVWDQAGVSTILREDGKATVAFQGKKGDQARIGVDVSLVKFNDHWFPVVAAFHDMLPSGGSCEPFLRVGCSYSTFDGRLLALSEIPEAAQIDVFNLMPWLVCPCQAAALVD